MTTQPFDTDPAILDTSLFRFSEWLDGQKLMRDPEDCGDHRSHARLVADFLAADAGFKDGVFL